MLIPSISALEQEIAYLVQKHEEIKERLEMKQAQLSFIKSNKEEFSKLFKITK